MAVKMSSNGMIRSFEECKNRFCKLFKLNLFYKLNSAFV